MVGGCFVETTQFGNTVVIAAWLGVTDLYRLSLTDAQDHSGYNENVYSIFNLGA